MLTNLDFLIPGMPWLPEDDDTRQRLERYYTNKKIFNGEHADVYEEKFKRIQRVIGNFEEVISYPTIINYQKLMSLKIADLLFGEPPFLATESKDDLEALMESTDFVNKMYEQAIDISRFGDGIVNIHMDDEEGGTFSAINPCMWIPVIDRYNAKKIINHVLAWQYSEKVDGKEKSFLKVQIHYKGFYEDRLYKLTDSMDDKNIKLYSKSNSRYILGAVIEEQTIQTGISDFAVIHTPNVTTSDRLTGYDDYCDVDSLISEILVRISQIERVLDKHADPSMEGPLTAAEKDPASGEWKIKMGGRFFMRDGNDDPETRYITWDGKLEASFKAIEILLNQLYIISELGSVLLGGDIEGGGQISGRAMRMRMISPLAKVKRIAKKIERNMKRLIISLAELNRLPIDDVSITWQDGLPNDPVEEAEIIASRTGQKATMSQKRALMQFDYMSEDDAEDEMERIREEESINNPLMEPNFESNDKEPAMDTGEGED